jgi:3-methyladenine DNA glycosylase/8-oxoguanine DNA glycosylase
MLSARIELEKMSESIRLQNKRVVEILPQAPFNFDATLHKPDHFPAADNAWQPGVRWQTMLWEGRPLGLKFEDRGTVDRPAISLSIWSRDDLDPLFVERLLDEIEMRYNFQLDLTEFYRKFREDAQLGPVIGRWRGMRPMNHSALYEYLIIAIVLQNATVRRSVNMMHALFTHYGTCLAYADQELYCFWEPDVIHRATEDDLRELKVGYRAKSIKRVSAAFARQEIDEFELRRKSRDEQRQALLSLYGIGPASVGYILVDVFHHLDELSHISPWEQKIYSRLFFDRDPDDPVAVETLLETFEERYSGYKMLAIHYIWEDLFWRRKHESVEWLERLIRL